MMDAATAYLGLGSNLGDRADFIRRALQLMAQTVTLTAVSSLYETAPWGLREQPSFLNAACEIRTVLDPHALLRETQRIEAALGRERLQRWGPRTLDLDILLYGKLIVETETLTVPHPLLADRAFVLVPLAEIAPDLCHPRLGRTIAELLKVVPNREGVCWWGTL